jgi:hypothetical protein
MITVSLMLILTMTSYYLASARLSVSVAAESGALTVLHLLSRRGRDAVAAEVDAAAVAATGASPIA